MSAPFADPAQVFAGPPSPEGAAGPPEDEGQGMPMDPNAMQGPPGVPPPTGEPEHDPVDLEGAIADAIETGCQLATAATGISAEEYMRFAQGVSYLADALAKLQPQPDPAAAAAIQADQRQTAADQQHVREMTGIGLKHEQAMAAASNRPTQPQPSGRG